VVTWFFKGLNCELTHLCEEMRLISPNLVISFAKTFSSPQGMTALFKCDSSRLAFLRLPHPASRFPPDEKQKRVLTAIQGASDALKLLGYDVPAICEKWTQDCGLTKPQL
jgi:hypothetical protein